MIVFGRRNRMAVAGLAALALMAGCSGGDDTEPTTDPGATGDASDPSETGGGDVKVQLYQAPTELNPLISSFGPNHLLNQLHWDALLSVDADAGYGPRLAESWDVSEDGTTWTFHLRDDVTWSDGEPFTADDVLFTYNLYANPASGSANVGKFANVEGGAAVADGEAESVSGLQAPDEHTFVVQLLEPNVAFLDELIQPILFVLPEHVVGEFPVDGLAENPFFREPTVGLGAYVFEQWVTDDEVELHANPEYREELGLDRVFAQFLTTDVATAQLETGEIDYAQVAAPDVARVEGLDGVIMHRTDGPGVMALHTAHDSGKLADPLVRQAIMYAIDRESLVEEVLAGEGKVVDTLVHGPDWAVPDDLTHYDYDPDMARQLLDEAGWDDSTVVNLDIVPGQRDRDTRMTIVAAQLQEVGINAEVKQYEAAQMSEAIGNREFDLLISGYGLFMMDPASMNARLMCEQIGGANISAYCNEDLDALLQQGVATTDQAEREAIYGDAQRIVNEEVPIIVLDVPNTLAATSERLQGFELNPSLTDAFWNAAEWSVTD